MRQYHKRVREQVAGTTRRRDQYDSTILPENPTNEDPGVFDMILTPFSPTGAFVAQIEPFRLPVQVARQSPATADKGNCNNNRKILGSESHNVALRARVQLLPKPTLDSIRPGLDPPFLGMLQMDASSLNLLRFCKCSPSHEPSVHLRCFRAKLIGQSFRGRGQNLDSFESSRSVRVFGRCHSRKSRFAPWDPPFGLHISRFVEGSAGAFYMPPPQYAHDSVRQFQS